jgi:curli production assembly/transport component CsgF
MGKALVAMMVGAGVVFFATTAFAGQLVYTPTNPTFGGNPLNGTFLLQQAQAQGLGPQSGQQNSPNLSGLSSALSNLGSNANGTTNVFVGIPNTP